MSSITAVLAYEGSNQTKALAESLTSNPAVERLLLLTPATGEAGDLASAAREKTHFLESDLLKGSGIRNVLDQAATDYLLLVQPGEPVNFIPHAIERFAAIAEDSGAALVYSDFKEEINGTVSDHPLIDYQVGSIRDSFDFGPAVLISKPKAEAALRRHGSADSDLKWAGLYDLRLKLSIDSTLLRIQEPLYTRVPADRRASGEKQFDYVDPRKRDYQIEMEEVATRHLKRIGSFLAPEFINPPDGDWNFPALASVVIPVRNRQRTIREAVLSALSQKADFEFNVIVVDNHSTDGTTQALSELAAAHPNLIHLKPRRTDLGIGGCWNEAVYSAACGKYAVQLDSDDLYADQHTLQKIIAKFQEGPYAMVVGSYTIVDFDLKEIPPGLIDHREWTRENGRNNVLRINGIGAPRAFFVPVVREIGFPNTSYGEDYAIALKVSRDYEIGRIYESIYFARRWEGNSDAALPLAASNRYDAYKDHLRTVEMLARKRKNQL